MVKRDWKKTWLICILTGGVYNWYIIFNMYKDIFTMENRADKKTMSSFAFIVLSLCTGSLFALAVGYIYHKKALALAETYNVKLSVKSPVVFAFISVYVPIWGYMIPIKNHNKLIDGYEASLVNNAN